MKPKNKNYHKQERHQAKRPTNLYLERERRVHSGNAIILVAGDVKPSAGINKGRIPALENIIRIREAPSQRV